MRFLIFLFSAFVLFSGMSAMAQTTGQTPAEIVQKAESYLNSLKTLKANFTQMAQWNQTNVTGDFYLSRPGKLRFDYDPPVEDFIVADGNFIFYYDGEQEQQSNAPIGATLADFLLRDPISLSGKISVSNVEETLSDYFITLVQTEDPHAGSLTLVFKKEPFTLNRWIVVDGQGLQTQVALKNIETGMPLDRDMFYYIDPKHGKERRLNE